MTDRPPLCVFTDDGLQLKLTAREPKLRATLRAVLSFEPPTAAARIVVHAEDGTRTLEGEALRRWLDADREDTS